MALALSLRKGERIIISDNSICPPTVKVTLLLRSAEDDLDIMSISFNDNHLLDSEISYTHKKGASGEGEGSSLAIDSKKGNVARGEFKRVSAAVFEVCDVDVKIALERLSRHVISERDSRRITVEAPTFIGVNRESLFIEKYGTTIGL